MRTVGSDSDHEGQWQMPERRRRRTGQSKKQKPSKGIPTWLIAIGAIGAVSVAGGILIWGGYALFSGIRNSEPGRPALYWTEASPAPDRERQIRV